MPEHEVSGGRGDVLGGRYLLQGPIGCGGTADVFCGTDQVLGREVAVKVFRAGTDTVTADRFCDEARMLARLSHRALVTVFDAGRHKDGAFMVTELIRGVTLRTRMDAGPLSLVQVVRIGSDIASALDHVHANGVIHHDVKPSNILLSEGGAPHLADFGLSRAVHDRSHGDPDTLVGTLAYMAPEQFLGHGASTASDVYALGVTLLEALTGHREYQGTPVEIGTAHLLRQPQIPDGLPDGLARLLKAMTDQAPQARPDAAAVHERLQALAHAPWPRTAEGGTSTHRTPSPPSASRAGHGPKPLRTRTVNRRRAGWLGLAAAGVAGICALATGGIPAGENTPTTSPSRGHLSEPRNTEAAGPAESQPAVPAPRLSTASESPVQRAAQVPSATGEPRASTAPYTSSPVPDPPAKAPAAGKAKENPGKAKGKKDKGR
ncbi:protein kinase [Streptomyces sp. NPDC058701]|uniref:serine/threonine-protein kinase n=1 Tax=Streptomyces sp. NPDC058701 TaxID=3346608 RepID=UPI0036624B7F